MGEKGFLRLPRRRTRDWCAERRDSTFGCGCVESAGCKLEPVEMGRTWVAFGFGSGVWSGCDERLVWTRTLSSSSPECNCSRLRGRGSAVLNTWRPLQSHSDPHLELSGTLTHSVKKGLIVHNNTQVISKTIDDDDDWSGEVDLLVAADIVHFHHRRGLQEEIEAVRAKRYPKWQIEDLRAPCSLLRFFFEKKK